MLLKKPVVRKANTKNCETCMYRKGDFYTDVVYPNVIRIYCKARHADVDAEIMSKDCDFWALNSSLEEKKEEKNPYGL